ncbi:MAG: hypothetical protein ACM3TR_11555 [Caulobacteraceae bacterium]
MTTLEQLDQINAAIASIEGGAQEYRIGNRQLRRPDLSILYQERRNLQQQLGNESDVPPNVYVAAFDRR